jgi:UDP-N-acetylmuramoylalanine--D-glutamate ligase
VDLVETLSAAVETASGRARPGDVVLLSPAGTSFDAYASFEQRGVEFRSLVRGLAEPEAPA